jgi:hypothetical protein
MHWSPCSKILTDLDQTSMMNVYTKIEKDGKVWLWAANRKNPADHIFVDDPSDKLSLGYGGATIKFILEDDSVYTAKGPWHSNAEDLFKATGVDLRDKHLTYICVSVGLEFDPTNQLPVFLEVLHLDDEPTVGSFERYREIAKKYPEAKFFYVRSAGGAQYGPLKSIMGRQVDPEDPSKDVEDD